MSVSSLARQVLPLKNISDLNSIVNHIPDTVKVVLIGEASHGTQEFYSIRAELTKQLILQKGFNMVACESDWPDALEVNRYFKGQKRDADDSLTRYSRFPTWMWRNTVVKDFVEWMKQHNDTIENDCDTLGFYGLDVYSLQSSRDEVVNYLETVDKDLAQKAREHYGCFDKFGVSEQSYAYNMKLGLEKSCESSVLKVLHEMVKRHGEFVANSKMGEDEYFYALQNAKVIKGAEKYYRNMMRGGNVTWNIRDKHMMQTLLDLMEYKEKVQNRTPRVVVWAHNSHLGRANHTDMGWRRKQTNLGELVAQHFPRKEHYNVGFTTFTGTVTAASNWHDDPHFKKVNRAMEGSYERLFHDVIKTAGIDKLPHKRFAILMDKLDPDTYKFLSKTRLERYIGVIYRPQSERMSHLSDSCITRQFDCVMHIEHTSALVPLEIHPQWKVQRDKYHQHEDDVPETYPFGL
mmetsp:Transcript_1027/g.3522  ORF Transcript_1027/g.3522 Transcript_1027/m.3522 type:complete len:461 (-) Transcript_1027:2121-3503(-)